MSISINPQQIFRWLATCIVALVCLHVFTKWAAVPLHSTAIDTAHRFFELDSERYFPAIFSTLQLGLAVPLLLLLYVEARRVSSPDRSSWLALAFVFCFLAADEYYAVHERLMGPVKRLLGPDRAPAAAWVVPYGALVVAFVAYFLKFWQRLPRDIRWQMAVAGSVYVGGAIGMEIIGSRIASTLGDKSLPFALEVIAEETMEMTGIALFIRVLLKLIGMRIVSLNIQFGGRTPGSGQEILDDLEAAERYTRDRRVA